MHRAGRHGTAIAAMMLLLGATGCVADARTGPAGNGVCSGPVASEPIDPAERPIAFTSDRSGSYDLWLMESDGSNAVRLTTAPHAEAMPSWSPDGARLAFVSAVDLPSDSADICVINADGSGLRNLTDTANKAEVSPSWSPDGRSMVYTTWDGGGSRIHVMDGDGGGDRVLVSGGEWPNWSPDGERVVFSMNRGPRGSELWTMDRDGSNQAPLTDDTGEPTEPAWSPDGRSIAYVLASGDPDAADPVKWNEDIFVMSADGGSGRRMTTFAGNDHWPPAWSPDGGRLAFTADGEENVGEIFVIDLSTLVATRLTDSEAHDMFPAWRR